MTMIPGLQIWQLLYLVVYIFYLSDWIPKFNKVAEELFLVDIYEEN